MNVKEYRSQVERDLAEAAASPGPGLPAPAGEGAEAETDTLLQDLTRQISDKSADVSSRIHALEALRDAARRSDESVEAVIHLVRDASEPAELRKAALKILQEFRFSSKVLRTKRPEYLEALRWIVDDPDAALREAGLGMLAKEKDHYAQERLIEGLEHPDRALIPEAKALQLLGYDIHVRLFPLMQRIATTTQNALAKVEAVRLLASDPGSSNVLTRIFRNKGEAEPVRRASAVALQSIAPAAFEQQAREVALDDDENDEIRATCVTALSHFANRAAVSGDDDLRERLERLITRGVTGPLKRAVENFRARHNR